MAKILSGKEVVEAMNKKARKDICELNKNNIVPKLAILRIGQREDDLAYERTVLKRCEKLTIEVKKCLFDDTVSQDEVIEQIKSLNNNKSVHGVLFFRPLPLHIDENLCCKTLSPSKDVDAATPASLAGVFMGNQTGYAPCTAQACMEILKHYHIDLSGKRTVVIGRSLVVGKPVSMLLLAANATVCICHTKTKSIKEIVRQADIVIVACGKPESIDASYFTDGQVVIDVGISWNEDKQKLCGDVAFDEVQEVVGAITPVPGGVGTVTTSVLLDHVIDSAKKAL